MSHLPRRWLLRPAPGRLRSPPRRSVGRFALLIFRLGRLLRFGLGRFRLLGRRRGAIRLETDAIIPRRGRWLIELEVKSAALVQRHRNAPFLLAGTLDDSRAAAARIAQSATEIAAHIALHMHRLFRAVDRALGEYVAENARLFQPVLFWIDRPGKPGFTGLAPILMRIFGGRAVRSMTSVSSPFVTTTR